MSSVEGFDTIVSIVIVIYIYRLMSSEHKHLSDSAYIIDHFDGIIMDGTRRIWQHFTPNFLFSEI